MFYFVKGEYLYQISHNKISIDLHKLEKLKQEYSVFSIMYVRLSIGLIVSMCSEKLARRILMF